MRWQQAGQQLQQDASQQAAGQSDAAGATNAAGSDARSRLLAVMQRQAHADRIIDRIIKKQGPRARRPNGALHLSREAGTAVAGQRHQQHEQLTDNIVHDLARAGPRQQQDYDSEDEQDYYFSDDESD